jgi:hypothetical protein
MPTKDELIAEYDDARTERDRAHLDAYMIQRWARLSGRTPDAEELVDVQRRIRVAERQVKATENEFKAQGWMPTRGPQRPKNPLAVQRAAEERRREEAEERQKAREAAGYPRRGRPRRAA